MRAQAVDTSEAGSWIDKAAGFLFEGGLVALGGAWIATMRKKLKRLDSMQQHFVTRKEFDAAKVDEARFVSRAEFEKYIAKREARDEKVDEKLDGIKDAVVESARQVHERVDQYMFEFAGRKP
jgi:uncharacterized protein (DUF342 family)